jgi:hypothetical protein
MCTVAQKYTIFYVKNSGLYYIGLLFPALRISINLNLQNELEGEPVTDLVDVPLLPQLVCEAGHGQGPRLGHPTMGQGRLAMYVSSTLTTWGTVTTE